MKKAISLVLVLILFLSLSINCFAETQKVTQVGTPITKVVSATYVSGNTSVGYSVDISWDELDFVYTAGEQRWDEIEHKWVDDNATGTWNKTTANINVANDSSADIGVKVELVDKVEGKGVELSVTNPNFNLLAPAEGEGTTTKGTAVVNVLGDLNDRTATEGIIIGAVTVTISAV